VLLDAAAARAASRLQLPRRGSVILLASHQRNTLPATDSDDGESQTWQLAAAIDVDHVVDLPAGAAWLAERLSSATHGPQGSVVGVVGGRGGAGASVLASALAVTAAHAGYRTMLVDADPLGGGLDLLLGRESYEGARWPDLIAAPTGGVDGVIYDALPRLGELSLLSWDRGEQQQLAPKTVRKVLAVSRRGSDLVVVDLPRMPDAAARVALEATDVVVVVVPAEVRSVAAAARVIAVIRPHCRELRVVVRVPAPAGLKAAEVAAALRLPLLGTLRGESSLATSVERGVAPGSTQRGSLSALSTSILDQLLPHRRGEPS
ncbi:MAG: septum site-determining protein Ssd, partial [Mycobacteriales bacterium]